MRSRFGFTAFAAPLVVEAPTWFLARAYARVRLGTDELIDVDPRGRPRDAILDWEGNGYAGTLGLIVSERLKCAWTEWRWWGA